VHADPQVEAGHDHHAVLASHRWRQCGWPASRADAIGWVDRDLWSASELRPSPASGGRSPTICAWNSRRTSSRQMRVPVRVIFAGLRCHSWL